MKTDTSKEDLRTSVTKIFKRYIDECGPESLNVSSNCRNECETMVNDFDLIYEEKAIERVNHSGPYTIENYVAWKIFHIAYTENYKIVKEDLFLPYIAQTIAENQLNISKFEALWFLPKKTVLKLDGTVELNAKNELSFKQFFSFPDPVVEAESQSLATIIIFLTILFCLLD
eukprot:Pgem_evm1s18740